MSDLDYVRIAPDCGDTEYLALYDARGRKIALVFDPQTMAEILGVEYKVGPGVPACTSPNWDCKCWKCT